MFAQIAKTISFPATEADVEKAVLEYFAEKGRSHQNGLAGKVIGHLKKFGYVELGEDSYFEKGVPVKSPSDKYL